MIAEEVQSPTQGGLTPQPLPNRAWLLPLVDVGLALLAFVIAYFIRYELQILRPVFEFNRAPFEPYLPYAAFFAGWLFFNYRAAGLYKPARGRAWLDEAVTIVNGVTGATVVLLAVSFVLQPTVFSRLMFVYMAAVSIVLLSGARVVQRMIVARRRRQGIGVLRALVIGGGSVGRMVVGTLVVRKQQGYLPIGYLDDDPNAAPVDFGRVRALGGLDDLEHVVSEHQVNFVVIALSWREHDLIMSVIERCRRLGVDVSVVPDVFQLNLRQLHIENLDGVPLLRVNGARAPLTGAGGRLVKRGLDLGLLLLLSPAIVLICGLVALAITLDDRGRIFYAQERVGENGRRFKMLKFRSMIPDADSQRQQLIVEHALDPRHPKIPDDPRMTRVGRFIRRTSLDELPNAVNVLLGQMSIIGPRPPTPDEVLLYQDWQMQRLSVRPGITGLWQVSGRSDVPFDEMCLLDIYYIENWSLRLDLQILLMTLPRVLTRHGAY